MLSRLVNTITWLLVAGSVAIILGGLTSRPILLAAVPTSSMLPVLQPGDLIPVIPMWGTVPRQGQIVVFKTENDPTWIVHRIIGGDPEEGFITRGDNNPDRDPHRVFARHVAGSVPTVGSGAMRIPRLGALSFENSPLSNPLTAGIAIVLGFYLLMSDVGAGLRRMKLSRVRRIRLPEVGKMTALAVYTGLGVAVFSITLMTTWSLSTRQVGSYRVVEQINLNNRRSDTVVAGQEQVDTVQLTNRSPLPQIIGLYSDDPQIRWEPAWFVIPPGGERQARLLLKSDVLGEHHVELRQTIYLPLLPVFLLETLSRINWYLPMFIVSLVPVVVVVAIAASDTRVCLQLQNVRLHIRLSLGI